MKIPIFNYNKEFLIIMNKVWVVNILITNNISKHYFIPYVFLCLFIFKKFLPKTRNFFLQKVGKTHNHFYLYHIFFFTSS